jgi:hypothetical protein
MQLLRKRCDTRVDKPGSWWAHPEECFLRLRCYLYKHAFLFEALRRCSLETRSTHGRLALRLRRGLVRFNSKTWIFSFNTGRWVG